MKASRTQCTAAPLCSSDPPLCAGYQDDRRQASREEGRETHGAWKTPCTTVGRARAERSAIGKRTNALGYA